jgi:peptide/nickel transport system substrate-binding protein
MLSTSRRRALATIAAVAISGLVLTACSSQRGQEESEAPSDVDTTFVFGASGDPSSLDPAFASDGESFRISRQIFEGLVGVEPGTADPAPLLAESWEQSEDGLSYTFQLKEGVTFHDLRHTAITRLAKRLSVMELAKAVGIIDLKTLQTVYYNPDMQDIAAKLD